MSNPASSKKRKVETGPKYYAVKAGFEPGVYTQYSDCQRQTAGFKGAICTFSAAVETSARLFGRCLLT
jgi:viroplasmin and RNaseH domain-containing protein